MKNAIILIQNIENRMRDIIFLSNKLTKSSRRSQKIIKLKLLAEKSISIIIKIDSLSRIIIIISSSKTFIIIKTIKSTRKFFTIKQFITYISRNTSFIKKMILVKLKIVISSRTFELSSSSSLIEVSDNNELFRRFIKLLLKSKKN